jgi:hypothetical protein
MENWYYTTYKEDMCYLQSITLPSLPFPTHMMISVFPVGYNRSIYHISYPMK